MIEYEVWEREDPHNNGFWGGVFIIRKDQEGKYGIVKHLDVKDGFKKLCNILVKDEDADVFGEYADFSFVE